MIPQKEFKPSLDIDKFVLEGKAIDEKDLVYHKHIEKGLAANGLTVTNFYSTSVDANGEGTGVIFAVNKKRATIRIDYLIKLLLKKGGEFGYFTYKISVVDENHHNVMDDKTYRSQYYAADKIYEWVESTTTKYSKQFAGFVNESLKHAKEEAGFVLKRSSNGFSLLSYPARTPVIVVKEASNGDIQKVDVKDVSQLGYFLQAVMEDEEFVVEGFEYVDESSVSTVVSDWLAMDANNVDDEEEAVLKHVKQYGSKKLWSEFKKQTAKMSSNEKSQHASALEILLEDVDESLTNADTNLDENVDENYNTSTNVDDIFELWDDTVDDNRKDIEHGITTRNNRKGSLFSFSAERRHFKSFKFAAIKMLKSNNWEYEWDRHGLFIPESKPVANYSPSKDADDIFFLWDDVIDDDREGIEHGTTTRGRSKGSIFNFDVDRRRLKEFKIKLNKLLDKNKWHYEWDRSSLFISESKRA